MSTKSILRAVFGKFSHFYTKFGKLYQRKQKNEKRAYFKLNKKGKKPMKTTGTNQIQDLWQDIQFIKRISSHPISETSKRRIIYKYNLYKQLGGERTDEQIEKWKGEIK